MNDNADSDVPSVEPLDRLYANYLRTCAMSGFTPISRERADGLIQEWTEVLSGRPEPTTH
jgi:hypothetical protein